MYNPGVVVMLVRMQSDNAVNFFNKYFEEYQQGFAANGELLKVIQNNDMILNLFRRELDRLR